MEVRGLAAPALDARGLDPLFHALQLGREVALGAGQGLLSDVVLGDAAQLRAGDFQVVAEDAVVTDPQVRDARPRALPGLQRQHLFAAVAGVPAHRVEVGIEPGPHDPSLGGGQRQLVQERLLEQRGQGREVRDRGAPLGEGLPRPRLQRQAKRGQAPQGVAHRPQVAGTRAPRSQQSERALEIREAVEPLREIGAKGGRLREARRTRQAGLDHAAVARRSPEQSPERPRAHRRLGAVEEVEERVLLSRGRVEDFQIPQRDVVHHQRRSLAERAQLADLRQVRPGEPAEVFEERAGGAASLARVREPEGIESAHRELAEERLAPSLRVESRALPPRDDGAPVPPVPRVRGVR